MSDDAKFPLSPILSIVVYHGRKKWDISTQFRDLIEVESEWQAYVPDFKYSLHDLTLVGSEDIVGPLALRAALQVLKHIFDPNLAEQLPKVLGYFTELVHQRDVLDFLIATLRYISGTNPHVSHTQVEEIILNSFPDRGGYIMHTVAQEWIKEGEEKGKEEGILETLLLSISEGLGLRFREEGINLYGTLKEIDDIPFLRTVLTLLFQAESLDEIRQVYDGYIAEQEEGQEEGQDEEQDENEKIAEGTANEVNASETLEESEGKEQNE